MKSEHELPSGQKVVSQEEWLKARSALLAKEKALTQQHDELARQRRELPCVRVDKSYVFGGPRGKVSLADLFDGRSQLVVYHFMLGPDWKEGCPSCSYLMDHLDGAIGHLKARDRDVRVGFAGAAVHDRGVQKTDGVAFRVGFVPRDELQQRLWCLLHQGTDRHGKAVVQLRHDCSVWRGVARA